MSKKLILLLPIFVFLSIGGALWNDVHSSTPLSNLNLAHPVVVELFTSQGCSSCPPADHFLNELSEQPQIIALSCHVTYWDSLGWKDPLSQDFCTNRQRASAAQRRSKSVFTPELLINGKTSIVGSKRGAVTKALKSAAKLQHIPLTKQGGMIAVAFPDLPNDGYLNYTIWVFGTQKSHDQKIEKGENRGKRVRYARPVLSLKKLENWNGKSGSRTINIPKNSDVEIITILAQAGGYGPMVAVGEISLK